MHILITDPHTDGGGQVRYIQSLTRELLRLGHRVTIGCRHNSVLKEIAQDVGCEVYPEFYFARGLRLSKWWRDLQTLRNFIQREKPDIIHVNGSQDHWVAGIVKGLYHRNSCVLRTRHNTYVVKDTLVNRVLNRRLTTYQICVCEMVRETLAAQRAFDGARMTAIHNGVDADVYCPRADIRDQVRSEFGYAPHHIVCGMAARLVPAKGHTYLFQALHQMKDDYPDLRLLVLGQGKLEDALKSQAADLCISDRILFAGYRDDMEACVQAMDIGILPSIDCDTSSFSLKEQMATGIPVLTSDYGGLTEIVTDNEEGFVVAHATVTPLEQALRNLLDDSTLRQQMGAKGRERVLREFTCAVFAEKTVDVYKKARELSNEHTPS